TLINDAVAKQPYEEIVLIGHSLGAVIARRVYLVACGEPHDFKNEHPLASIQQQAWAGNVRRIVMLGAFNRGWHISERMGWLYGIGFNLIAIIGHLLALGDVAPTIFDIRLGATFIVQTRLHWLAHRRARLMKHQGHLDPIVIQLIGTRDDLVSPFDQVDIAVDGTTAGAGGSNKAAQRYFFIELPDTKHENAVKFGASAAGALRRDLFNRALIQDPTNLQAIAIDPDLLVDQVPQQDPSVTSVVFVIHGIRDDGFWTHRIAERVRQVDGVLKQYRSWTPSYG